ncbi:MAG: hypothetical protein A3K19_14100 [Lentisphaerae bacterium RIFOXYB12_FULL_65_16]|nr:MAG: hypothetical protein A3K18_16385 [Lentisphaerae bacterium RIFOXYA12_64_32]OGV89099.1 MAG: hypothetical protein A3K19_14100 [Lentisphaerae bacterium RIFOXYB12_FULL_65_16]
MPHSDKIWHAAQVTRIVSSPRKLLETFGETSVHYYVLSDLLDTVNQVRIRQGLILAERPRILAPGYLVHQLVENFGEEARQYAEWLAENVDGLRVLQYGLRFRKEEYGEEVVGGALEEVAKQVATDAESKQDAVCGVVIGVDDLWEVSLLRFASHVVRESLPGNVRDLSNRGLLTASSGNVPNAVRIEIESDFRAAVGSRDRVEALGRKLREYGLFNQYEDRLYGLLKTV